MICIFNLFLPKSNSFRYWLNLLVDLYLKSRISFFFFDSQGSWSLWTPGTRGARRRWSHQHPVCSTYWDCRRKRSRSRNIHRSSSIYRIQGTRGYFCIIRSISDKFTNFFLILKNWQITSIFITYIY